MSLSAKAVVCLKFPNKKQLTVLLDALVPETQTMQTTRANAKLETNGLFLILSIEAEDTVALRATLNAYLRWINSTLNVIQLIEGNSAKL